MNNLRVYGVFYLMFLSISPYIINLLAIPLNVTFFPLLVVMIILMWSSDIKISRLALLILIPIIVIVISIKTESVLYFNRYIFIFLYVILAYLLSVRLGILSKLVGFATIFISVGIFLSIISFFYYYFGGDVSFSFSNTDGRSNHLILFTLSNTIIGNVIRPSFIYDEPGAFSFFICVVVLLREFLGQDKKITIAILFSGLITLSLVHIIVCFIYLLFNSNLKVKLVTLVFVLLSVFFTIDNPNYSFFYQRFDVSNGRLSGDNRSNQIENYFNVVNDELFLYGNYKCFKDGINHCRDKDGDQSSNPLTPLYNGGVFILILQLIFYSAIIYGVIKNNFSKTISASALIVIALSLQRPYIFSVCYSLSYMLCVFMILRGRREY